jgi:hypothetical protein
MQSVEEHQEIPKEKVVVKPVKGRKKRHRGRKPAAGRRGEPKELTRGDFGSGKKLAAVCRKMTPRATVAWGKRNVLRKIVTQGNCGPRKRLTAAGIRTTPCAKVARGREHGLQRQGKDDIVPQTQKQQKEGEGLWKDPECNSGIRDRGLREQLRGRMRISDQCGGQPPCLKKEKTTTNGIRGCSAGQRSHLGSEGTLNRNLYEIFIGRIAKQVVVTPSGLQKIRKLTLWRGRPLLNEKRVRVRE